LQPDDPTGQTPKDIEYFWSLMIQQVRPQRILNPSLSCLSGFGTVSQDGAREELMPEFSKTTLILIN